MSGTYLYKSLGIELQNPFLDSKKELHSLKTMMTIKHPPFEDVFPIENWDFPNLMLVFSGSIYQELPSNQSSEFLHDS